ncbi:8825_t:CDS:2, partial [Scutellospora calospora]
PDQKDEETKTSDEGFMYTVLKDLVCHKHLFASMISVQITSETIGICRNICEISTATTINDKNNTANSFASYNHDIGFNNENIFTNSDNELIINTSQ